jgi:N-acetylglucosaminyldiphosphoundecaprenol N-acetyl-beta-D-mannosaminyltransferase
MRDAAIKDPERASHAGIWRDYLGAPLWEQPLGDLIDHLQQLIDGGADGAVVAGHNLHTLAQYHANADVRALYRSAQLSYLDGWGVWLLCRLLGRQPPRSARFSFMDTLPQLLGAAQARGWRVYFLGATPASHELAMATLRRDFPTLDLCGHHGHDSPGEAVAAHISAFAPQLLFVGLGVPRQEEWILRYRERVAAQIILPSGATLDYVSGAQAKPPAWVSRAGLAWLYRMAHDPLRLVPRYLLEPFLLLPATLGTGRRLLRLRLRQGQDNP